MGAKFCMTLGYTQPLNNFVIFRYISTKLCGEVYTFHCLTVA